MINRIKHFIYAERENPLKNDLKGVLINMKFIKKWIETNTPFLI